MLLLLPSPKQHKKHVLYVYIRIYIPLSEALSRFAGRDLRAIFALLRKAGARHIPQRSALLLLRALTAMARHLGPTTFFNFADDGAGIMRNTPLRFPGEPTA